MIELGKIIKSEYKKDSEDAPGKSVNIEIDSSLGGSAGEMYSPPGSQSMPTPADTILFLQLPNGGNQIGFVSHNYNLDAELLPGEKVIFSTDSEGLEIKCKIEFKQDGKINIIGTSDITVNGTSIKLNGDSKPFVTHAELDTALQGLVSDFNAHTHPTAPSGPISPPETPLSLDISAAATTTVKTGG